MSVVTKGESKRGTSNKQVQVVKSGSPRQSERMLRRRNSLLLKKGKLLLIAGAEEGDHFKFADIENQHLFRALNDGSDSPTLPVKKFYSALEAAGLDVEELELVRPRSEAISLSEFSTLITPKHSLIAAALSGDLIFQQFQDFSRELKEVFDECAPLKSGEVATYIPDLAKVDPEKWGVSFRSIDNQVSHIGDTQDLFAIQSVSKVVTYLLALQENGEEAVHRHVGREPSGRSFNEMALNPDNIPHNPYINAGAIVAASLVKPDNVVESRLEHIMETWQKLVGPGEKVSFDHSMYKSEKSCADRNFSLGFMMQEARTFDLGKDRSSPPRKWRQNSLFETFDLYFRQCSICVSVRGLALAAATLANGGVNPLTRERIFEQHHVNLALGLMYSCGMYDYSGEWNISVGLPAKSGVSGCLMVPVPGLGGLATWAPPLDRVGNSAKGVRFVQKLCSIYGFHYLDKMLSASDKIAPTLERDQYSGDHLITAANGGDTALVKLILASGVSVNSADYDKRTALMLAASEGHFETVQLLLSEGADKNMKDRWGGRAIDDALRSKHKRIAEYLQKYTVTDT